MNQPIVGVHDTNNSAVKIKRDMAQRVAKLRKQRKENKHKLSRAGIQGLING